MKSFKHIIILSLVFLISCKNNKNGNRDKIVIKDSIVDKTVKVKEPIKKETIPPFETPSNCGDTTFDSFFEHFGKDSTFQKRRVKYPLKELYIKSLDPTIIKIDTTYNSSEYNYIDFTEDKYGMEREYGKYTVEIEKIDSDSIHYKNLGYDNGIHIIFKFKRVGTCWLLVEILDEST
jgi:hypothetical protein